MPKRHCVARLPRSLSCYWLAYNTWWNWHGLDLAHRAAAANLRFQRAGGAVGTDDRPALGARGVVFLDQRADVASLHSAGAHGGTGLLVFWAFWTAHTIIAACAVYDIVVAGFRPGLERPRPGLGGQRVYVALVGADESVARRGLRLHRQSGWHKEIPPFVDALGPWPQRAIVSGHAGATRLRRRVAAMAGRRPARRAVCAPESQ